MEFSTNVKKQHTVSRFILDNFGFGKKNKRRKLYTFDKESSKIYQQSVFDATTRNTFYNLKGLEENISLEGLLSEIEGNTAPIIKKIISNGNLLNLSDDDRAKIALFVVQHSRSFNRFNMLRQMKNDFKDKINSMGVFSNSIDEYYNESTEVEHNDFLELIMSSFEYAEYILNKKWLYTKLMIVNLSIYLIVLLQCIIL